jgi:hypothetical protein
MAIECLFFKRDREHIGKVIKANKLYYISTLIYDHISSRVIKSNSSS